MKNYILELEDKVQNDQNDGKNFKKKFHRKFLGELS